MSGFMIGPIGVLPASGGSTPTWTPTTTNGNPAAQDPGASTATFSSVAIGSPAASDVIVAVFSSDTTVASSITCNAVAMTKQIEESSTISGLQIWSITASAAGVTGSATTTFVASAGGTIAHVVLEVGKLTGVNSTPTNTGSIASGTSIGVTVPATGFAIVGSYATVASALSWSGGTQDLATTTSNAAQLDTVNATATGTVSETGATTGQVHMVYAAWGP